ncbi:MAG: response regulator [Desulfomonile tiedjei]|nr:response regulator [Desulfomonile tiedjei]
MTKAKLMLIDDETAFVTAMEKRLAKRNMAIVTAYSGPEGLKKLEENPEIDVVVLDIRMPGMDGIQTLREIKRSYPLIEVILLTGHATFESAMDGMKLGAFDYLMKPCDLEELLAKVEEARIKRQRHLQKIQECAGKPFSRRRSV